MTTPRSPLISIAHWGMRILLRLHPAPFRREHAAEIHLLFAERYAEERARGLWFLLRFLLRTFSDLACGVLLTRARARTDAARGANHAVSRDAMLTEFLQDVRFALRMFGKNPGFATLAVATLALGIGSGTTIFSVADAVVLRGLPFDQYDRLVVVLEHDAKAPRTFGSGLTTSQMFLDWRQGQQSFESLAAASRQVFRLRNERDEPDDLWAQRVTHNFFSTLRVQPLRGRGFTAEEDLGVHRTAILSYGFWRGRFGGSPEAIGKTIQLNDETYEIVGIMPPGFSYPVASDRPTQLYVPASFTETDRAARGKNYNWTAIGRLKRGVQLAEAGEQMNVLAAALDEQYPVWSPGRRVRLVPLHEHVVGRVRTWMLMLLGAVTLVLLIACTNVANLLLTRATARTREVAIRAALGASRGRLIRSFLAESIVLSLMAALIGILLALNAVDLLRAWLPQGVPRVAAIAVDARVLIATIAAALLTGIAFGIVPAFHGSRPNLVETLKESGRSSTISAAGQRLLNVLVVGEVALGVLLVVGAGLFITSFVKLMRIEPGFDYKNILNVDVSALKGFDFQAALARGGSYAQEMIDAVKRVPNVESVEAVSGGLPFSGSWSRVAVTLPGGEEIRGEGNDIDRRIVTPGYLQFLRIPLKRGRYLNDEDRAGSPPVLIINEAAAGKYWPGQDALNQRIMIERVERTVVGIVGNIRHLGPEMPERQEAYTPLAQDKVISMALVMRTKGDPLKVFPLVKSAIWSVNRDQRIFTDYPTLEAHLERIIAQRRFNTALLVLFGLLGLVIAAAGIYGVMAYVVAQRTSEIGVRMALGATREGIVWMVLRRAAILVSLGLIIGSVGAWYLSAGVGTFLFQIDPHDLRVLLWALGILAMAGLVASMIPAWRAARVDPVIALRHE